MKVKDIKCSEITLKAGSDGTDNEIECIYVCDLLGWVMGNIKENSAWVTILGHINVVAVATLSKTSCIIIAEGATPTEETVAKAEEEGIPLYTTDLPAFEIARIIDKQLNE